MDENQDDISNYINGSLSPEQRHALEKKALDDPFLADALEGAESTPLEFANDVHQLSARIRGKKGQGSMLFTPLRLAAGLALLIGIGSAIYLLIPPQRPELLVQKEIAKPDTTSTRPDTSHLLTLAQPEKQSKPTEEKRKKVTPDREVKVAAGATHAEPVGPSSEIATHAEGEKKSDELTDDDRITAAQMIAEEKAQESPVPSAPISAKDAGPSKAKALRSASSDLSSKEEDAALSEVVVTGQGADTKTDKRSSSMKAAIPKGGIDAYHQYLETNLRYPEKALQLKVKGIVTIQFMVSKEGNLDHFKIMNSLGNGCDEEVIRLVKEGPAWLAGTQDQKPVESEVLVSLTFDPEKVKK